MPVDLGDVARPVERVVVQAYERAVAGDGQVLLDVVGALLDGQPVGGEGMFGSVRRCAAMRDELLAGTFTTRVTGHGPDYIRPANGTGAGDGG